MSGNIHFIAKDACIDQEFLSEDLAEIILDLPNLIIAEQDYERKQSDVIRFRVSGIDKARIEKKRLRKDMILSQDMCAIWQWGKGWYQGW